jgi:hypothetical protein
MLTSSAFWTSHTIVVVAVSDRLRIRREPTIFTDGTAAVVTTRACSFALVVLHHHERS